MSGGAGRAAPMRPTFDIMVIPPPERADSIDITAAVLRRAPRGRVAVQARHKSAPARDLFAWAKALHTLCQRFGAPFSINDRIDIAQLLGAPLVQLPEHGLSVAQARRLVPGDVLIGRSCHDRAGIDRASRDGAAFATLGPVGTVAGKNPPLSAEAFASATLATPIDVYALGGVDAQSGRRALDQGARGLAVIRCVYCADAPAKALDALFDLFAHSR